ncbi:hypothetical protein GCM10022239_16340 [Leifsonia bigeumensis]|uniref:NAD(P)-binding domain-containing protein n=1 Tax=Leifsonella bigeumensis TaxID=433643 RepID=A0ABP7FKD1_9MICO
MRIAITGGTGFVGRHLTERFDPADVVAVSRRTGVGVDDVEALAAAFEGCEVVAHLAGIDRELGKQTFQRVHIDGTANVIEAAKRAGVRKIVLLSFLRARPDSDSGYLESKWAAEELVRASGLDYTILKAGMIYGRGDQFVDRLSRTAYSFRVFPAVGFRERPVRPIPVGDLVDIAVAAVNGRMSGETVAVTGAEELLLSEAFRRVGRVVGKKVWVTAAPVWALYAAAQFFEWTMKVPLVAKAPLRMLAEGVVDATPPASAVPDDLTPQTMFTDDEIRRALPEPGGFGWSDLRFIRSATPR